MRKLLYVIMACIVLITTYWIICYCKNEYCTYKYGQCFKSMDVIYNDFETFESFKVINYSKLAARVYVVTKDKMGGFVLDFNKEKTTWKYEGYECIWARYGSADNYVWPYFYHSPINFIAYVSVFIIGLFVAFIIITIFSALKNKGHREK